jgi:hypothetical protein
VSATICSLQSPLCNRARFWSAIVFIGCAALLVRAATLTPDPQGLGTHRQMGLPSCSWIAAGDGPCPTCGMTTAFSLAAHGRLVDSFLTQPAAALLALLVAMTAWVSGYTMMTGCPAVRRLRVLIRPATFALAAAVLMAAWALKIAMTD